MKVKSDHRSKFSNLSNWKEEAWKKSGLQRDSNPWPPQYRCDALPTELWSHTLEARSIYLSCFQLPWALFTYIYIRILAPNVWLHSSVGRASQRYRGGYGFESRWSPDFFSRLLLSNCLNWKINCDDPSSLSEILLVVSCYRNWNKRWTGGPFGTCTLHADFTSTSELSFASFSERVLAKNVSHESDLIFMRMNVQVTYSFILIVSTKTRFTTEANVNLGLGYSSMSYSGSLWLVLNPTHYQDGRVVKALDLSSKGRIVRVGSNPTPGNNFPFNSRVKLSRVTNLWRLRNTEFITRFISSFSGANQLTPSWSLLDVRNIALCWDSRRVLIICIFI